VIQKWRAPGNSFVIALVLSSLVSEGLFGYGAFQNHSLEFDYLTLNLALAWLPLLFVFRLNVVLKNKLWSSWEALGLSILWLIFLPNSFYMVSDFIHLQDITQTDAVYYAVLLTSFIYTGVALGFSSLFLVHLRLKQRLSARVSLAYVLVTLFICSVAIYFGRDLRWSSWDILTNPGGLLYDIYNRVFHLVSYPQMVVTILAFFILLSAMYNLLWHGAHLLQTKHNLNA
jgi:uncharacterized membrane protein